MEHIENYNKEQFTFDFVKLNIYSVLVAITISLIYLTVFYLFWGQNFSIHQIVNSGFKFEIAEYTFGSSVSFFIATILGIIVHELIHGITFACFTKTGFKSIKFGVIWKKLAPYCHCKEPLFVKHYRIGGIMPAVILGFLPFLCSLLIWNAFCLIFSLLFTLVAIGDFSIIYLLRNENSDSMVLDHPTEVGCYIYRKNES